MERKTAPTGVTNPNSTAAPTMADFNRYLVEAVQQWGTVTVEGEMDHDETLTATIVSVADLGDYMPISASRIADLMDVMHDYTASARTNERQAKADRAHDALTCLISIYMNVTERRQELCSLASAAARFEEDCKVYTLAEYRREEEAKASRNAKRATKRTRQPDNTTEQ